MELSVVVAVLGTLAGIAAMRYGGDAVGVGSGKGYARRASLALQLARRQAIAEGVPAAVVVNRDGGAAVSLSIVRADGSDALVDDLLVVPDGVTLTTAADRWEFDWSGTLTAPAAGGTIAVAADAWTGTITVFAATGHARLTEAYAP